MYKAELIRNQGPWQDIDAVEVATAEWVHWFNTHRLHSSLGHVPPIEYENEHYRQIQTHEQDRPSEPQPPLKPGRFTPPSPQHHVDRTTTPSNSEPPVQQGVHPSMIT